MASITSWTRFEPRARNEEMGTALQACVWDPLWLLARQGQVGELTAEDAGSPIEVQMDAECARLNRYLPGAFAPDAAARARDFDGAAQPLEALVERERIHEDPPGAGGRRFDDARINLRAAAEAGLRFVRLLAAERVGGYRAEYLKALPLSAAPAEREHLDGDTRRWLEVIAGRVVDGTALYDRFTPFRDLASGILRDLPAE